MKGIWLPERKHGVDQECAEDNLPDSLHLHMLQVLIPGVDQTEGDGEGDDTEGGAEEDDGVAYVVEIQVLDRLGAEDDEEDDKHAAVQAVVEVGQRGRLHLDEADGGQGGGQDNEQGDSRGDGGVLDPQDVAPEQELQLTVLKPVSVKQPGEGHLSVAVHGFHTVIHLVDTL